MKVTKVGVIGAGLISQFQAVAYGSVPTAKIQAVCDIDGGLAERKAKEWGAPEFYTDYNEMLRKSDIEAVEILLPHQLHKPVTQAAAEAGKHVSVMKPMALTVSDAKEMVATTKKHGVLLNISENYLFYEPIMRAIEIVKSGKLGTPWTVLMERVPALGGSEKYAEPNDPNYWRMDKKRSGGMVFDDMVHYDATARFLMQSDIEAISAILDKPQAPYELPAMVSWKHKGANQYGNFAYSWVMFTAIPSDYYTLHESVELICEQGVIRIPNISAKLSQEGPLLVYSEGKTEVQKDVNPDYALSFVHEVEHFIDSVQKDTPTKFNGEEGVKQVQFAAAIQKAGDEQRTVKLSELEA